MTNMLLGVDFGTGACKATIINEEGNVLASKSQEYPSEHLHPGWSEQNPDNWIDALINTVKSCIEQVKDIDGEIKGVGFSASTHNGVLIDSDGKVIRDCIMWNDQRSGEQCERLMESHGEMIFEIGMQMPTPTWTLPQLLWVKENEPENYKKIDKIMFTKDYIRSYVVGGDFVTDVVDAQGSLLYDARNEKWSSEICGLIDLPIEVLPKIHKSKDIVGSVSEEMEKLTGLKAGTPVIAGCSDTAAEDYGSGAVEEGQIIVKMATAGNVNMVFDNPYPNRKAYTYPYAVEGKWYLVAGTNASASSYRWLRDSLYQEEKELCDKKGEDIYKYMDKQAKEVPVGSRGLIFHPFILGERCPYFNPNARGNFFGISVVHDKKYFARAVLEGVAFSLYDSYQVVREHAKVQKEIRLIGGGANSPLWSQILCDVFGLPVIRPEKDDSSFGIALLAGVGVGLFEDEITAVKKTNKDKLVLSPNMENHERYMKFFKIYKDIVKAQTPIWEELAEIANK